MLRHPALLLAAFFLAASGCILSSDDENPPPGDIDAWQPEFYATVDSVYAWFPFDWPDSTVWTWNRAQEGAWEYIMEASVRLATRPTAPVTFHLAFATTSDGTGVGSGTFRELAEQADGFMWAEDPRTRERLGELVPFATVRVRDDGVEVRAWRGVDEWVYGNRANRHYWEATFTRRGRFEPKIVKRPAHYMLDHAQDRARAVDGPLTPDDYMIMDLVARSYVRDILGQPVVLLSPSSTHKWTFEEQNIRVLRADQKTVSAFAKVRTREVNIDALAQVGYIVVDRDNVPPGMHAQFSAIGYNPERTQAMVYGSYYCGNLCAEGEIVLLRKVFGYWVIQNRVGLWIS